MFQCKFQSNIYNGFDKKVNSYKNLYQNSKSKKGHNSYKNLDRVMYSCLLMEVMMVNKRCKFQSNICNGFDKKMNWYKKLNQNSECIGTKNLIRRVVYLAFSSKSQAKTYAT